MPIEFSRTQRPEGIPVPYWPVSNSARTNRGFIDTRGRPDVAAWIAEAATSSALKDLLVQIATQGKLFSLGCDAGRPFFEPHAPFGLHQVAAGYVQVVGFGYRTTNTDKCDRFCDEVERAMSKKASGFRWQIRFAGVWVMFNLAGEPSIKVPSISIDFLAYARTTEKALKSREALICALTDVLNQPVVTSAFA